METTYPGASTAPELTLSGRPLSESLSRVPENIKNFKIFGKPWTDVAKEAAVSGALGAAFRIGLGSTGVSGVALSAAAAGGVGGIKEHFKMTNQKWADMRTEQGVSRLGFKDTMKGFFKLNKSEGKQLAMAVGRSAAFGAVGNMAAGFIGESAVGHVVKGAAGGLRDLAGEKLTELAGMTASPAHAASLDQLTTPGTPEAPTPVGTPTPPVEPGIHEKVISGAGSILGGARNTAGGGLNAIGQNIPSLEVGIPPNPLEGVGAGVKEAVGGGFSNLSTGVSEAGASSASAVGNAVSGAQELAGAGLNTAGSALDTVGGVPGNVASKVGEAGAGVLNLAGAAKDTIGEGLGNAASTVGGVKDAVTGGINVGTPDLSGAGDLLGGAKDNLGGGLSAVGGAKDALGNPLDAVGGAKDALGNPLDGIGNALGGAKDALGGGLGAVGGAKDALGNPLDGVGNAADTVKTGAKNVAGGLMHDVGLKAHEMTGLGVDGSSAGPAEEPSYDQAPGRGIPLGIGKVVDVVGGAAHNVGLKAHDIVGEAPGRGIPILGGQIDQIGGLFHDIGLKAHELIGWGMNQAPAGTFIEPSKYFPPGVQIADNSPEWIKDINNLNGEYGRAIQAQVGANLPDIDTHTKAILDEMVQKNPQIRSIDYINAYNHAMHIAEDKANRAFDSSLKGIIEGSQDLEEAKRLGQEAFAKWLQDESDKDLRDGLAQLVDTRMQIDQALGPGSPLVAEFKPIPSGQTPFEIFFPKDADTNNEYLRKVIPNMVANLAANEEGLVEGWFDKTAKLVVGGSVSADQVIPYEAYMGELNYLMQRAEVGDINALQRLKDAYKYSVGHQWDFKRLSAEGIKRMLELVKRLG